MLLAVALPAAAEEEPACVAPSTLAAATRLPRLAASLKETAPTTVMVLNSSSGSAKSNLTGEVSGDAVPRSFPSYVQEALRSRYPDGRVLVVTRNEPRRTAAEVIVALPQLLAQDKPALVIWQTGTHDAIRGVGLDGFADAVTTGIDLAHEAGADVIIVSPQYSPRTDFAFDVTPYVATLRWVARSRDVGFFDRMALMRYWSDEAVFDFSGGRSNAALFNNVHRCIGRLLIRMISDGVYLKTVGSH